MTDRIVNGCPVVREEKGVTLIHHRAGWMIYSGGPRVATLKTEAGAARRFEQEVTMWEIIEMRVDSGSVVWTPELTKAWGERHPGARPADLFRLIKRTSPMVKAYLANPGAYAHWKAVTA